MKKPTLTMSAETYRAWLRAQVAGAAVASRQLREALDATLALSAALADLEGRALALPHDGPVRVTLAEDVARTLFPDGPPSGEGCRLWP